mgnify:CR=1 FL=1
MRAAKRVTALASTVGGEEALLKSDEFGGLGLAALTAFLAARYFVRRIGGYTGDCLGATQQVSEIAFYLGLLAVWPR